jgi:hypothetical protein
VLGPSRAGERKRQSANRVKREIAAVESEAKKLRVIDCSSDLALPMSISAPAQASALSSVPSGRAGERKRQAASRLAKEQAATEEAAVKRQRTIATEQEAATPAAKALARLRARVIAKQSHTG